MLHHRRAGLHGSWQVELLLGRWQGGREKPASLGELSDLLILASAATSASLTFPTQNSIVRQTLSQSLIARWRN